MHRHQRSNTINRLALELGALSACFAACAGTQASSESTTHTSPPAAGHVSEAAKVTSVEANQRLVEGNGRFVAGHGQHARQDADRRTELANTQHPFAVILGCADSRTGPEILFDQGLGDLFVVREAGNVVDDHTIGSIEYAVEHLHSPLIVVLGHERCGAVAAARDTIAAKGHAEGHIASLVESIRPAVEATAGQDADATCKANIRNMVHALKTSEPLLQHRVETGEVAVVGACYDLDTGVVTFLPDS
jgi:carbonic anhydrase